MNQSTRKERQLKAAEHAAAWLVALQSQELTDQERAEFTDWLRESPLHVSEMLHACRVHRDLSAFSDWSTISPTDSEKSRHVTQLFPGRSAGPSPASRSPRPVKRVLGIAASLAGVAVLVSLFVTWYGETAWQTQLGERREVTLEDGSIVDLAPASRVTVRFTSRARSISLDRGEALFHVAKNPNRPFIVEAAGARVRAVGTVFNVEQGDRGVAVTVVEGRVTVTQEQRNARSFPKPSDDSMNVTLGADEQVLVLATGRATPVRKVNSEMETAWASGQLIFENESIAEIARRFNLYNRTQIRVIDADLAARRVGGMFRATDPESFVAFVESAARVTVNRVDPDVIVLNGQSAVNERQ